MLHRCLKESKLDSLKQRAEACCQLFGLRNRNALFLNRLRSCCFIESLHGERDSSVLDGCNLDFYFVADGEHFVRCLKSLLSRDLGDVDETVDAVAEAYECAVRLQGLYGSFRDKARLNVGNALRLPELCGISGCAAERKRNGYSGQQESNRYDSFGSRNKSRPHHFFFSERLPPLSFRLQTP